MMAFQEVVYQVRSKIQRRSRGSSHADESRQKQFRFTKLQGAPLIFNHLFQDNLIINHMPIVRMGLSRQ
ncbi:MAG: hypothetical protein A3B82_01605 [Methylophilales bacterium RIFCSPHIGHO2_02_FULL_57_10]|nr:MAG: hypothetical protein A3B82_01605 [Methylophilales bacterium RIFCSPHIGHO2_02_FULL_57_10]